MKKRGTPKVLKILISLVLLVVVIHIAGHFAIYGTGIELFGERGISGLAIGPLDVDQVKTDNPSYENLSKYFIVGEWVLLIALILFTFARDRITLKKEIVEINLENYKKAPNQTDLDLLYEVLKDKKSLKLSTIARIFKVEKDLVMEWVETLESGNLASVSYPRFGEPEARIA